MDSGDNGACAEPQTVTHAATNNPGHKRRQPDCQRHQTRFDAVNVDTKRMAEDFYILLQRRRAAGRSATGWVRILTHTVDIIIVPSFYFILFSNLGKHWEILQKKASETKAVLCV